MEISWFTIEIKPNTQEPRLEMLAVFDVNPASINPDYQFSGNKIDVK